MKATIRLTWDTSPVQIAGYELTIQGNVQTLTGDTTSFDFQEYENTPVSVTLVAVGSTGLRSDAELLNFTVPPFVDQPPPAPTGLNWSIVEWTA